MTADDITNALDIFINLLLSIGIVSVTFAIGSAIGDWMDDRWNGW